MCCVWISTEKEEKMKILYILNIAPKEGIFNFSISAQIAAKQLGMEYHIVGNFDKTPIEIRKECETKYDIFIHHIDLKRNPFDIRNCIALKQLVALINKEQFQIIHCNTPTGGVLGRIAGRICKSNFVIYQSHGFHFYRRAPIINWLLYYPAEKILAKWTDALLTINEEDYLNARKFKLRNNGKIYKTLGVGLDIEKFTNCKVDKIEYRKKLGIPNTATVLITVGEIAIRKNQKILLEAMKKINDGNLYLLICGEGPLENDLISYCKKNDLINNVFFLGRRNDIAELCHISDIYCFPSKREGMGIAPLEGMAAGLPLVSSNIQGIKDYSTNGVTGFCLEYDDLDGFVKSIKVLMEDKEMRMKMGNYNKELVKKYDRKECVEIYKNIYIDILKNYNGTGQDI